MNNLLNSIAIGCVIFFSLTVFAQTEFDSLHINSRRITWNSSETNGTYDIQWARSSKGPWHDTWDTMLGIPATNGVIKVDAPHYFRLVYRPLPCNSVGTYMGYRWNCYRTKWLFGDEWVSSFPEPRDGFNYGVSGDGRGAMITTHVNDPEWKDYTVGLDIELLGIDPSFNPENLPLDYREGKFMFRIQNMEESWFEGRTLYALTLQYKNYQTKWSLQRFNDYGLYAGGLATTILSGYCSADLTAVNRITISCIGNNVSAWINNEFLGSFSDTSSFALSQGGIGMLLHAETMGRFRNMVITHH